MIFLHFKDKYMILSVASNSKDSGDSAAQGISVRTRLAQKRLIQFSKAQNLTFKSRNKKFANNKTYVFNHFASEVVEHNC